jgi:simple sugar transport system ATP-binding protein
LILALDGCCEGILTSIRPFKKGMSNPPNVEKGQAKMSEQFLTLHNISKSFSGVKALDKVHFTIHQGEICCLAGENGSGKSTLIKIIAGVETPDNGDIIINGRNLRQFHPIDSIREGIQIIYQDFSLFPNLTVAENIAINYQLVENKQLVNWKEVRRIARAALEKINVSIDLNTRIEELSVADKQLVAISRALLQNAKLIIMDEPTSALTQKEVVSLLKIIKSLQNEGISILFVSHKLNEVLEISEQIVIIRNGKNVIEGPTKDFDRTKLVFYMTGREIDDTPYVFTNKAENSGGLLRVDGLSRKGAFQDISFKLLSGEIVGITGLLGSGRTELAMALFGLRPADHGAIFIDDRQVCIKSVQDAVKYKIGYVPEDRLTEGLFLPQSIGKNTVASIIDKLIHRIGLIDRKLAEDQIQKWIQDLKIVTPSDSLPVQSLSGGNQQRVVIAKWLATSPRILILNGPTVGVDIGSKKDIHDIIKGLARQGMGVLIISDDIPEILQTCNRILLMKKGRIVEEFTGEGITENELTQKLTGT